MELWARKFPVILPKFRLPRKFRDLLHAANLRHGTDGFTSPLKEGDILNKFVLTLIREQGVCSHWAWTGLPRV